MPQVKNIPLHASVRVYASGNYVVNGVKHEHIQQHINYNTLARFGCALFIDGECFNTGYLSSSTIEEWLQKLKEDSKLIFRDEPGYKWNDPEPKYRTRFAKIPYK